MNRVSVSQPSERPNGQDASILSSHSRLWWLASAVLLCSLLLGGATRPDILVHLIPRALAIIAIAALVWRGQLGFRRWAWPEQLVWGLLLAVPLIQIVPLPWAWWTGLPGREFARDALSLVGIQASAGLSLAPDNSWNSWLALLPAFAFYAFARQANGRQLRNWAFMVAVVGLISAVLGIFQMVGLEASSLRFYAVTNGDAAVGLFSNANHHASFLACVMLILAYWYGHIRSTVDQTDPMIMGLAVFGALIVALAMVLTLSQAGLVFLLFTSGVFVATLIRSTGLGGNRSSIVTAAVLLLMVVGSVLLLSDDRVAEFTKATSGETGRLAVLPTLLEIVRDNWLLGTGLGTFDPVYRSYEPVDLLMTQYLNHAHNDYLELIIEAGLLAVIGLLIFAGWWMSRGWTLVRNLGLQNPGQLWFIRMAFAGSAIMLAHSLVDYPLRGAAISTLFALFCAIIAKRANVSRRVDAMQTDQLKQGAD